MSDVEAGMPNDFLPLVVEWPKWFRQNAKQQSFLESVGTYWETIFLGGNGSGKSCICYWVDIALACGVFGVTLADGSTVLQGKDMSMDPPLRIKVLVRDFEHGMQKVAKETLFDSTYMPDKTTIGPLFPKSMMKRMWSKEDKTLYLNNGSRIEFMTSEQRRFQHSGTNYDILHPDEEPQEPAYDESVRGLRNAKGGGKVYWGFTPPFEEGRGPSWSKAKKFDVWDLNQDPHLNIIRASIRDNPAITDEFIKRFSRGKTEEQLKIQLEGEYPTWGRMVHPHFHDKLWNPTTLEGNLIPMEWEPPVYDEDGRLEFAIDWHQSKPAAALWTYEDRGGNVYVYDELAPEVGQDKTILELSEIIFEIEGRPQNKPRIYRYGDPKMKDKSNALISGFNAWEAFRHAGIFLNPGYNRQPEVGVSIVNDFIRGNTKDHPRVFVRENCVNLRRALKNHYWVEGADGIGKPDPKWSDYPICLRYILQTKSKKVKRLGKRKAYWPVSAYKGLQYKWGGKDYGSHHTL